jgi:hypothetical protein
MYALIYFRCRMQKKERKVQGLQYVPINNCPDFKRFTRSDYIIKDTVVP